MSDVINAAVEKLNQRIGDDVFDGIAKFIIEDEGSIMVDNNGARAADEDAEVTLTATAETFQDIMTGDLNPATAFMSGKLSVDGGMGLAMKLASILA